MTEIQLDKPQRASVTYVAAHLQANQLPGCTKTAHVAHFHDFELNTSTHKLERVAPLSDRYDLEAAKWNSENAQISNALGTRVTNYQVFLMIIELMKLETESTYQLRSSRKMDRQLQLEAIEKVVNGYKEMSRDLLMTGIGSAVMGLLGAGLSIYGEMGGEGLFKLLGNVYKPCASMDPTKTLSSVSQMLYSMRDVGNTTAQAQQCFAQGNISKFEHGAGIRREEESNATREKEARDGAFKAWQDMFDAVAQQATQLERALA